MPKEMVPYPSDRETPNKVELLWVRGQMVQIGVSMLPSGQDWDTKIGTALRGRVAGTLEATDEELGAAAWIAVAESVPAAGGSLWVDLERWQCNALVRLVRKARDQAYGKDE